MEKLKLYFKLPYEEKGVIKATLDFILRFVTVAVWVKLAFILVALFWDGLLHQYDPALKLWWFAYSFTILLGATWIAYIVLFVRDYYEPEEE